jgi:glycerophosphoryl diester phosphodiesterase
MRPQVVAHRGASHETAEHTLGAYTRAIELGAQALECDVRLTADGHLVCVHDRDLRRTASSRGVVSTMNLADLDELDFARWKNPWAEMDDDAPDLDPAAGKVLTLRSLLETVAAADRRVEVAIETKHPTRYAGLVERRLVGLLDEFGWCRAGAPARVMSFSQLSLRRLRTLAPDLRSVMLFERVPLRFRDGTLPEGVAVAGPSIEVVRAHPRYVERCHRQGHPVHVWTVDSAEDIDLCVRLGVEAIITNRPGTVLTALGREPGRGGSPTPA